MTDIQSFEYFVIFEETISLRASLSAIEYRKPLSAQALEGFFHYESAGKDV